MTELHPSTSAVGAHFEQEVELAIRASRNDKKEGRHTDQGLRSERGFHEFMHKESDLQIEEKMRLAQ